MSLQHLLDKASERFWRTDSRTGRSVYLLLSNDPRKPSPEDILIGVMETSTLAEEVVATHNQLVEKFGKRYSQVLENLE